MLNHKKQMDFRVSMTQPLLSVEEGGRDERIWVLMPDPPGVQIFSVVSSWRR